MSNTTYKFIAIAYKESNNSEIKKRIFQIIGNYAGMQCAEIYQEIINIAFDFIILDECYVANELENTPIKNFNWTTLPIEYLYIELCDHMSECLILGGKKNERYI